MKSKVPVLLVIFNRPETTRFVFESIRKYQPDKLYIASDGPRESNPEEKQIVEETRKMVLYAIDWDCEIKTLFRENNVGCAVGVSGGISWFFEYEEYGIIIEDDCVLSQDFYALCEELLPYYQNEEKVMQIGAFNPAGGGINTNTYYFTSRIHIWGWATWKRAWNKMDIDFKNWTSYPKYKLFLKFGLLEGLYRLRYWNKVSKEKQLSNVWDTRWFFTVLNNQGYCIGSDANLSLNIGVGDVNATNCNNPDNPFENLRYGKQLFPLEHPSVISYNKKIEKREHKNWLRLRKIGAIYKIKKLFRLN